MNIPLSVPGPLYKLRPKCIAFQEKKKKRKNKRKKKRWATSQTADPDVQYTTNCPRSALKCTTVQAISSERLFLVFEVYSLLGFPQKPRENNSGVY